MILRSQLKQMSFVAIGENGSNLSYGNVRTLLIFELLLASSLMFNCWTTGFKIQQMLWPVNFSWRMYTVKWEMLLLIYSDTQNSSYLGLMFLGSLWKFLYLHQKMLWEQSAGSLVVGQILIYHCTCGCLWTGFFIKLLSISNQVSRR